MSIDHHLRDKLRALKLSGIFQTLDARLTLVQNGEIGAIEFLDLLFQDEIERRNAAAVARNIQRASFHDHNTLEGFDFMAVPKLKTTVVRDLATGLFIDRHESVILCGPTGVGKTHLAQGLGHIACRQGRRVLFTQVSKALRALLAARADHTWDKAVKKYITPDLLILDDFGLQGFTQPQGEDLYAIISERCMKSSTIVTSNRPVQDWLSLFPDPIMAQAVVDRMRQNAHLIVVEGESYRGRFRPGVGKDVCPMKEAAL
jgi:DNA replication protein DnaC